MKLRRSGEKRDFALDGLQEKFAFVAEHLPEDPAIDAFDSLFA